jgi:hypothetical protein
MHPRPRLPSPDSRGARRRSAVRVAFLLAALSLPLACSGGYTAPTGTSPVGRITVSPEASTIGIGESVVLQIAAFDTLGQPVTAGFVVSHSNRASVRLEVVSSTSVRAIGLAPGMDRVQVSDHYLQTGGSALIRVQAP